MIKRITILAIMISFDVYLHAQDVFLGTGASYWFWFPTSEMYNQFWFSYWSVALLITLSMGIGYFSRVRKINEMSRR